jgi:hypothetical protein
MVAIGLGKAKMFAIGASAHIVYDLPGTTAVNSTIRNELMSSILPPALAWVLH